MTHIVFNTADVEVMRKAQALEPELDGDILLVRDDYAVGPLGAIHTPEGAEARRQWWRGVLAGGDLQATADDGTVDDPAVVAGLLERLQHDAQDSLWIWAAQNKHDVSGYYWLISQLDAFQGRVFILYLNNLPFINERGGIFYPRWMHEIPPREYLKARKLARPVTSGEFEVDTEEWRRLCTEETGVRLLEGGKKLVRKGLDHYDDALLRHVTADWQKAARVISQFLVKGTETTGDAYLLWRLKTLTRDARIEARGRTGLMRDLEVRLPQAISPTPDPADMPNP
jgi:hypothetical protein